MTKNKPAKRVAAKQKAPAKATKAPTKAKQPAPPKTVAELLAAIDAADKQPLARRLTALDELEPFILAVDDDELEAMTTLETAQRRCLDLAMTDDDARAGLVANVRATGWRSDRIELLGKLSDAEVYKLVRDEARKQLDREYHDTKPAWLFALGAAAQQPAFADDARPLVLGGFQYLVKHRKEKLVNSVAFSALAFAAANIQHPDTGPALHKAFRIAAEMENVDAHYALNLTAGPIAIAISAVDYQPAAPDLAVYLDSQDADADDDVVMQCRYARWMLAKDIRGAMAWLRRPQHKKNVGFAAAVLADLDHKRAAPAMVQRLASLKPVAKQAIGEARTRLDKQQGPPAVADRMIWMFGRVSSTERALGAENDSVFVQRAGLG